MRAARILIGALFSLLLPIAGSGSVSEPMRWEWQTGYRNDAFHWHLQDSGDESLLTYSEHDRNLQAWENALSLRVIYRDIALFARGASAFGHGSLKQRFAHLSFTSEEPLFSFHTAFWTLDGEGTFGYAVNLTPDRTYKVILIPFLGYGVSYEHLNRPGSETVFEDQFSLTSTLPGSQRMCWFGPLIGGSFLIQPGNCLQFEAGYAYHWLHLRFKTKIETDTTLYASGMPLSETQQLDKLTVKDGSNLAHSGWARLDYLLPACWRVGLLARIQYCSSRVLNASLKNQTAMTEIPQKYKARWMAISGAATLSRAF